jgi:hypothetical protein
MFYRAVSLFLIAAIVACPMWCASGLVGCCQAEQMEPSAKCCCHCQESSADEPRNAPGESPNRPAKPCQGVCGGAVVEKPCQLAANPEHEFLMPTGLDEAIAVQLSGCRSRGVASETSPGGNIGHRLRTLHMSFVC